MTYPRRLLAAAAVLFGVGVAFGCRRGGHPTVTDCCPHQEAGRGALS